MNLVLSEVEETITVVDVNEQTFEELVRVCWIHSVQINYLLLTFLNCKTCRPSNEAMTCFLFEVMEVRYDLSLFPSAFRCPYSKFLAFHSTNLSSLFRTRFIKA
jgi:hypothetical protein